MDRISFVNELGKLRPSSTFLALKGYRNAAAEIANYSIAFHISYDNALKRSIEVLEKLVLNSDMERMAREDLLESFQNSLANSPNLSDRERGYKHFTDDDGSYVKGIKLHIATDTLHIYGLVVHKRVLMPGNYKKVNSSAFTITKNKLRYLTHVGKFRQFKILPSQVDSISVENLSLLPPE